MINTKRFITKHKLKLGDKVMQNDDIYVIVRINEPRFGGFDYDIALLEDIKELKEDANDNRGR